MLDKLHIPEFTKSRPRRSSDNALVESKNGAIVRGWLGRAHIPADHAPPRQRLPPRPPLPLPQLPPALPFPLRGRGARRPHQEALPSTGRRPPYEKLKSLDGAADFLRPGVTFEQLDRVAAANSGLQAAKTVREARRDLFRSLYPAASVA